MDASQITKMLQKQNTRYINRCQTVDSSTLTWTQQLKSSSYIQGVRTCGGSNAVCNVPTQPVCTNSNGNCNYGGQGKSTTLMTGATQQFPNVLGSATGSATRVYSSDNIILQKAANNICGDAPTNPAPQNSYVITNVCPELCTNSNYSTTVVNNQSNPYLPPVDTYYALKNPCAPTIDQNQTHYLLKCNKCPTDTGMASLESSHTYVIEQPPAGGTISYIFPCYDDEFGEPYGCLQANQTLNVTITGTLIPGGLFTIQNIDIGQDLTINSNTGTIIAPNDYSAGSTYIVTYTQPNGVTINTTIYVVPCGC